MQKKPKTHQHRYAVVRWVIVHILTNWAIVYGAYTKIIVQVWMLDSYGEGIRSLSYIEGSNMLVWFVSTLLRESERSLQIDTELFWVIDFTLWWSRSILMGVVPPRMTMFPSQGHEGSQNLIYLTHVNHMSSGRFLTNVFKSTATTIKEWWCLH